MAKKLYVGNLPYTVKEDDLKAYFAKAGTVLSVAIISDRYSGRSKGFGFVEMEDADADKAIEMFHEKDFDGRNLVVNEARPKKDFQR